MSLFAKTSEPGCDLHDDESDHGYRPALENKRSIWRSALSDSCCIPWSATYASTARAARRSLDSIRARNNLARNEGFSVGAESQAPVVRTFAIRWLLFGVVLGANFLPDSYIDIAAHKCEVKKRASGINFCRIG